MTANYIKVGATAKIAFLSFIFHGDTLASTDCTTTPGECLISGNLGYVGSMSAPLPRIIEFGNTAADTARFTSTSAYALWVAEDVRLNQYPLLEKIFFDASGEPQRMDVKFSSSRINDIEFLQDSGETRRLQTSQLNLNYINFNTRPNLQFFGTDNQINLIDSRVAFNAQPQFISTAPLTINVNDPLGAGTESSFLNFSGNFFPTSTTINIENGNTLTFEDSGRVFASINSERVYFRSPVIGNVDNGTLRIDASNVYFDSTSFDFTNGSTLNTVGADSKV